MVVTSLSPTEFAIYDNVKSHFFLKSKNELMFVLFCILFIRIFLIADANVGPSRSMRINRIVQNGCIFSNVFH